MLYDHYIEILESMGQGNKKKKKSPSPQDCIPWLRVDYQ